MKPLTDGWCSFFDDLTAVSKGKHRKVESDDMHATEALAVKGGRNKRKIEIHTTQPFNGHRWMWKRVIQRLMSVKLQIGCAHNLQLSFHFSVCTS